jgi:hypothetical protein
MLRRTALALAATTLLSTALARPAFAGPPWISIELPANPLNPTTRGMYLLVRSYHHGDVLQYPVTGTATGLVDGRKRRLPLSFERTNIPGVMALRQTWPAGGTWVLAINVAGEQGPTALVSVRSDGDVHAIKVPTQTRGGTTYGRKVTQQDVDAALSAVAAVDGGRRDLGAASALLLVPAAAGLLLVRRRQPKA